MDFDTAMTSPCVGNCAMTYSYFKPLVFFKRELTLQLFLKTSALFLIHCSSSSVLLSLTGAENCLGVRSKEMLPYDLGGARPEMETFSAATFLASSEL